jgi:hypothetical protein
VSLKISKFSFSSKEELKVVLLFAGAIKNFIFVKIIGIKKNFVVRR